MMVVSLPLMHDVIRFAAAVANFSSLSLCLLSLSHCFCLHSFGHAPFAILL